MLLDFQVIRDHQVGMVVRVLEGMTEKMVLMESLEHQDLLETEESPARTDPQEFRDCQVIKVHLGVRDLRG